MQSDENHFLNGQNDGNIGIYRLPHILLKTLFSYDKKTREKLAKENEEYKSGFKKARKELFKNKNIRAIK